MRKAMAASALIHFGLIAGAWAAMSLPPAVDESDAESVSVSIISMDMVSTDPSEVVTQTSQTLVSAGEQHEAMEVPEASEAEMAEAVEPEMVMPVERVVAEGAPPEKVSEVAETEDLVSAEVLTASAESPQPVEAAIPQVTSEAATAVVETVKPLPSQSDPLEPLSTASISELTPEAPAQKLPEAVAKPVEATKPVQTANLHPLEAIEETAEATPIPLPRIKRKPVETAEPAKPQEQPVEQPKKKTEPPKKHAGPKPKQQPSKQASLGNGGAAEADTTASAKSGGGQGRKDDGGSAAASKYEGQVQSKVNRAVRRVAASRGGGGILRFALSANGSVLSVSVLKSSGDPTIDAAAVAAVNRGAPYPPIPAATGKTSWSFGLPFGDK
jgi:protein TonB